MKCDNNVTQLVTCQLRHRNAIHKNQLFENFK